MVDQADAKTLGELAVLRHQRIAPADIEHAAMRGPADRPRNLPHGARNGARRDSLPRAGTVRAFPVRRARCRAPWRPQRARRAGRAAHPRAGPRVWPKPAGPRGWPAWRSCGVPCPPSPGPTRRPRPVAEARRVPKAARLPGQPVSRLVEGLRRRGEASLEGFALIGEGAAQGGAVLFEFLQAAAVGGLAGAELVREHVDVGKHDVAGFGRAGLVTVYRPQGPATCPLARLCFQAWRSASSLRSAANLSSDRR